VDFGVTGEAEASHILVYEIWSRGHSFARRKRFLHDSLQQLLQNNKVTIR